MNTIVPDSHTDLLIDPVNGVLTTMMPDGQPQMSMVWLDYDPPYVLLNTTLERQKGINMQRNPKVNVLVIDSKNVSRFIEVRGLVHRITQDGAIQHADELTQAYTKGKKHHFYGDIHPTEMREKETRVIIKILPIKVNTNAIFS